MKHFAIEKYFVVRQSFDLCEFKWSLCNIINCFMNHKLKLVLENGTYRMSLSPLGYWILFNLLNIPWLTSIKLIISVLCFLEEQCDLKAGCTKSASISHSMINSLQLNLTDSIISSNAFKSFFFSGSGLSWFSSLFPSARTVASLVVSLLLESSTIRWKHRVFKLTNL